MKTSVSVVCYRYKVLANGESPLMLRISKEGRRTMKSLGVSVDPKFWNFDTNQPKPNCPNRQLIRQIVLKYETGKSSVSCPLKPKRFYPLKTFNNAPLKSLDRWGYYYFSLFPSVCRHLPDTFSV